MKIKQRTPVHILQNSFTPFSSHTPPPGASRSNGASQRCQMARRVITKQHSSNAEGDQRPGDAVMMSSANSLTEARAQHHTQMSSGSLRRCY